MSKGFNMGGMNRNQMMQQARKMQEQLLAAQQKAAETEVSSTAGGGAVKVTAAGDMRIKSLTIDPSAIDPDDVEMLQDMIPGRRQRRPGLRRDHGWPADERRDRRPQHPGALLG